MIFFEKNACNYKKYSIQEYRKVNEQRSLLCFLVLFVGASPSGKASAFGADIRWFESSRPSQNKDKSLIFKDFFAL